MALQWRVPWYRHGTEMGFHTTAMAPLLHTSATGGLMAIRRSEEESRLRGRILQRRFVFIYNC